MFCKNIEVLSAMKKVLCMKSLLFFAKNQGFYKICYSRTIFIADDKQNFNSFAEHSSPCFYLQGSQKIFEIGFKLSV
jgi:hypothetical protein